MINALLRQHWIQVLVGGSFLFFIAQQALEMTSNPNLFPMVLLLGAFVIPAAFVTYFNSQEQFVTRAMHGGIPNATVLVCFFGGGALGVALAGIIEFQTLNSYSLPRLFGVGLVEEGAKLIVPVALFLLWRHRSEADGLVFGVSVGMGFAALETMGYGFTTYLTSGHSFGTSVQIVLVRGLLSPVGHAAWTGLVCAIMWRERARTGRLFNWAVVGVFVLTVFLHGAWDIGTDLFAPGKTHPIYVLVGGISLALLVWRIRGAKQALKVVAPDTSPAVS
jgi:RsiW-degrading membrane proteinase PrsW (M82 family)